jgi:plasmid maintenance system antidote protein VapI
MSRSVSNLGFRNYITERGVTMSGLANMCNCSRQAIHSCISGRRKLPIVELRLASALKVSVTVFRNILKQRPQRLNHKRIRTPLNQITKWISPSEKTQGIYGIQYLADELKRLKENGRDCIIKEQNGQLSICVGPSPFEAFPSSGNIPMTFHQSTLKREERGIQ